MNRRLTLSLGLGAIFVAPVAVAQEVSIGYQGLPHKPSGETSTGIQVSEGVLMHVGAVAEGGYDSNVFYQDSSVGLVPSAIFRASGFVELTNSTRSGAVPSGLAFGARAGMIYRRYTSSDPRLVGYENAFMPSASLSVGSSFGPTMSVGFSDTFTRLEDAPYNPHQSSITRDNNQASAELRWAPGGGRLSTLVRYTNMVDIFEDSDLAFANSLSQDIMVDVSWKWLPKTALFVQARQGYLTYLDETAARTHLKGSAFPLYAALGLRGLITEKTSAVFALGYANGFYSCQGSVCARTAGLWGLTDLRLELTYRPTLLSRVVGGYRHGFQNSVISTFYYDDTVYLSFIQQLAGRFAVDLSGGYHHKSYQGYVPILGAPPTARSDNYFLAGLTADYFIRNWVYGGLGYSFVANQSAYVIPPGMVAGATANSVDYAKHQVFARLGISY